jgi:hypothetical protein
MADPCLCGLALFFTNRLPIGAKLLSEWLLATDVAKLDTAFCWNARDKFLQLIASKGVYLKYQWGSFYEKKGILEWLLLRGGKLLSLLIARDAPCSALEAYIKEHGRYIQSLEYRSSELPQLEPLLLLVAQHCIALEEFEMAGDAPPCVIASVLTSCRRLTTFTTSAFDINNCPVLSAFCTGLSKLSINGFQNGGTANAQARLCALANLTSLRSLDLYSVDCSKYATAMSSIAASCSKLADVRLHLLTSESAMTFARHCTHMITFRCSLRDPISAQLLQAISSRWPCLRRLYLECKSKAHTWSDEHDAAVVNLIRRLPRLHVLVCVNSAIPPFLLVGSLWDEFAAPKPHWTPRKSALRLLWVTRLSASALNMIVARCPLLYEIAHIAPPEACYLAALAASRVKSVNFPGTGVGPAQLRDFRGLRELQMWYVQEGMESALHALAQRSPGLTLLTLIFQTRPGLRWFPEMLRCLPALEELDIEVRKRECWDVSDHGDDSDSSESDGGDNDSDGGQDGVNNPTFVSAVGDTIEAFAEMVCPNLASVEVAL